MKDHPFLDQNKRVAKASKEIEKRQKLRHKDLMWAAKRRYLLDEEWCELCALNSKYGKWGPEQTEHEFAALSGLRHFFLTGTKSFHSGELDENG